MYLRSLIFLAALFGLNGYADDFVRPTGCAVVGQQVVVCTQSGSVLLIDPDKGTVLHRTNLNETCVDLVHLPNTDLFLIAGASKLLICRFVDETFRVQKSIELPDTPVRLAVLPDGSAVCVTTLWSNRVFWIALKEGRPSSPVEIEIGFPPHEILSVDDSSFVIADRFQGKLAIVKDDGVAFQTTLHGHNIRGLAVDDSGKSLLVSHQVLSQIARTTFADVHWGSLMQNVVSSIPIESLFKHSETIRGQLIRLGDTGRRFGDPAGIVALDDGFAVVSSGSDQILIKKTKSPATTEDSQRLQTDARPTRIFRVDKKLIVLNHLGNSISLIGQNELGKFHSLDVIRGRSPSKDSAAAGERAFFSASLSHDGWMSCHSCHTDGHSSGLLADTKGDESFGTPKQIPSLLGVAETAPWGWLGNKPTLHQQVKQTLLVTMQNSKPSNSVIDDLTAYLESLAARPSLEHDEGRQLFKDLKCVRCHTPDTFTSAQLHDVGFRDESGNQMFNPPSLRGLRFRQRFFHDGRAKSVGDVIRKFQHQLPNSLAKEDAKRLERYLLSL